MSIVFHKPKHAGVCFTSYTAEYLQTHSTLTFVFGDNICRQGKGGQAIIRHEPNAFGIVTKRLPSHTTDAYMTGTDDDYAAVDADFDLLSTLDLSTVVFPSSGIGTGLARLQSTAPELLAYIDSRISTLIGTDYKLIRTNQR